LRLELPLQHQARPQLRGNGHWLDRRRMGVAITAADCGHEGVPCPRLANLILAPKNEAKHVVTYIPRWGPSGGERGLDDVPLIAKASLPH
jgi:hypothetical protein